MKFVLSGGRPVVAAVAALLANNCVVPFEGAEEQPPIEEWEPTGNLCVDGTPDSDAFRIRLIEPYSATSNYRFDRGPSDKPCGSDGHFAPDVELTIRLGTAVGTQCWCDVRTLETEPELVSGQPGTRAPAWCHTVLGATSRAFYRDGKSHQVLLALTSPSGALSMPAVERELPPIVLDRLEQSEFGAGWSTDCQDRWVAEVVR